MREYSALFESILARQIMTNYVPCMPENLSVGQAAEMLVEYGLSSVPVINQNGELTGMISERDL